MTDETDSPATDPNRRRFHLVSDSEVEITPGTDPATGDPAVELVDGDPDQPEAQEWAWVAQWRDAGEPTPWATGLALAAFAAVLAGVAVWVLSAGLADRPVLAVALNLLVAGGLAPAMWLSRNLPVLRWFAGGAAVGVVGGWIAALMMLGGG